MTDHPSLFEPADDARPAWADDGLAAQWWTFHLEHPGIGVELHRMADDLARAGHRHLSIAMLWETLRFRHMTGSRPDELGVRFPNAHRAYYARWLMENATLHGMFATRPTDADTPGR